MSIRPLQGLQSAVIMGIVEELTEKINILESKLLKNEKIRNVLMERVEKSMALSGGAYTLFENNILLQQKVQERTEELAQANKDLLHEIERRKQIEAERENLIVELKEALSKIKTLTGFLPICASCKRIRNDKGRWEQIESYIHERSEAEFTHGICPDCMKKLYPEFCKDE